MSQTKVIDKENITAVNLDILGILNELYVCILSGSNSEGNLPFGVNHALEHVGFLSGIKSIEELGKRKIYSNAYTTRVCRCITFEKRQGISANTEDIVKTIEKFIHPDVSLIKFEKEVIKKEFYDYSLNLGTALVDASLLLFGNRLVLGTSKDIKKLKERYLKENLENENYKIIVANFGFLENLENLIERIPKKGNQIERFRAETPKVNIFEYPQEVLFVKVSKETGLFFEAYRWDIMNPGSYGWNFRKTSYSLSIWTIPDWSLMVIYFSGEKDGIKEFLDKIENIEDNQIEYSRDDILRPIAKYESERRKFVPRLHDILGIERIEGKNLAQDILANIEKGNFIAGGDPKHLKEYLRKKFCDVGEEISIDDLKEFPHGEGKIWEMYKSEEG